jgi:putative ABC transport system permease protein
VNIMNKLTLRGLKKNRTRTIVTIIGIILSAAMITGVTTLISSFQSFFVKSTIATEGNWHATVSNISYDDHEKLKNMDDISETAVIRPAGYSVLEGGKNEYKPYLYLLELSNEAFNTLPIHLAKGRLPQNENEVVISEHIKSNGGVDIQIGDTLDLDIGQRVGDDGFILTQKDAFVKMEDGTSEELRVSETISLTVVGVMSRLPYKLEGSSAPGYTIITFRDFSEMSPEEKEEQKDLSVFFTVNNPRKIYEAQAKVSEALNIGLVKFGLNSELLRYMGISNNDNFISVLYGLGVILIALIMVGSISLIYNSFSISVSERTKQFGLLSSVGATSKQLRHSVFFEAVVLAAIGIPLGVLAGVLGISVTLYFVNGIMETMMYSANNTHLTLSVSIPSIVVAALTALITILISARIPAKRSAKVSAVDAIRQTADIKLKAKQVKTSWLTRKLFGIEGDLALKNIRRNSRRYRSTVISLFVSIVLFVSATAFSMYLRDSVSNVYGTAGYDLYNYVPGEQGKEDRVKGAFEDILDLESVIRGSSITTIYLESFIPKEKVNESYFEELEHGFHRDDESIPVSVLVKAVDHDTYIKYIKELNLDESHFTDSNQITGVVIDNQHYYDYSTQKFINSTFFKDRSLKSILLEYQRYEDTKSPDPIEVKIAAFADSAPFGSNDYADNGGTIILIVDEDTSEGLFHEQDSWIGQYMYFKSEDPFIAEIEINKILEEVGLGNIINIHQMVQSVNNVVTIISIFSYGLIKRITKQPGLRITADLTTNTVSDETGWQTSFTIDEYQRSLLLKGLDDIGITLLKEDLITAYEQKRGIGL